MSFEVSPYELRFRAPGWAPRSGALVRWRDATGALQYGDLHPWEEHGDPSLGRAVDELRHFRAGQVGNLRIHERMVNCATFWPVESVPVHYLHWDGSPSASLARAWDLGVETLKIKIWHHTNLDEIRALSRSNSRFRIRLDGPRAEALAPDLVGQLDFVEDSGTERTAWDSRDHLRESDVAVVCKPLRDDPQEKRRTGLRFVVTSSLNHPLGLAQAAGVAERFSPNKAEVHGVASHFVYEADEFHDLLLVKDGRFSVAPWSEFERVLGKREWVSL